MMKKIFFLALCASPFFTKAQVTINAQLPPAGLVQKDQLWNLLITNSKADMLDVSIKMNLQDAVTGQVVLSASTGNILIGKGVKIINSKDIQPVLYNYNVQELSRTYLPMGTYIACYRLVKNDEAQEPLGEDCININIDPLSPPLLNTPADKSDIQTPYPQFSWMPPSPFDMFSNLSYDLLVTELVPGQNATEGIQYNTPIYSRTNISQPYETYASSFSKLEVGKTYAWQVVAKNGLSYAAKTEVWTFTIADIDPIKKFIAETPYVKMKLDQPEKGIAPNGFLKITYINETVDTSVVINIRDIKNNKAFVIILPVQYGENLLMHDLRKVFKPEVDVMYEASIMNSKNQHYTTLFEIKNYTKRK